MVTLGGSSGGSKSSTNANSSSTPVQLSNWPEAGNSMYNALYGLLMGGMNAETGYAVNSFPGNLFVPTTRAENQYLSTANTVGTGLATMTGPLANEYYSFSQPSSNVNPELSANYFETSMRPIMEREFYRTTLPSTKESYAGPGYWGSARANAVNQATSDFAANLAANKMALIYQDYLANRGLAESAANRSAGAFSTLYQSQIGGVNMLANAGNLERSIAQEEATADYTRWLSGETVNGVTPSQYNPFIQLAFQYLGLSPYSYGQNSTSTSTGSSNSSTTGLSLGVGASNQK